MSATTSPSDPVCRLLAEAYGPTEPPADFTEALLIDVERAFDVALARPHAGATARRWAWVAAAAAVCLATGVAAWVLRDRGQPEVRSMPPARGLAEGPAASTRTSPRVEHLGFPSVEQQVGRASLIVRARLTDWDNGILRYQVLRVIYGDMGDGPLQVDYSAGLRALSPGLRAAAAKERGREPTPGELEDYVMKEQGMANGKEMILYLTSPVTPAGRLTDYVGAAFDVPPNHRLDDLENTIAGILAKGSYLSPSFPQPAYILEEHLRAADLVVRAQLEQVTDTESRWTISSTIKGRPQSTALILPHDLFRLRAEAIVRHRRATSQPATQTTVQQEVAAERKRLMQAELVPHQKAILFLGDPKPTGEAIRAQLRQRIHEDASGNRLDEAEGAIRAAETHQLPEEL